MLQVSLIPEANETPELMKIFFLNKGNLKMKNKTIGFVEKLTFFLPFYIF